MMLEIPEVLDPHTLAAVQEIAARDELFSDGKHTAGWHARDRKYNLQAREDGLVRGLLKKVEQVVMQHPVIQAAAQPRTVAKLLLSRYEPGMFYGSHVDNALIDGQRTDLSFTLFISPPESYTGGELIIDETAGERHIKLDAGALFLYPSSSLHQVAEVTGGRRVAVVGWLGSYVRDAYQRELLFDVERAIHALRQETAGNAQALELLLKTRANLLRLWADG